ncbi:MAG: rod-binding protein [Lachnospiraceae bacterium]|nr:rod-binding protein [Lachnospiraceae bacterium]MBQ8549097.1 rod-binding protein [Lachnospiraceae bacterium]
MSIGLSSELLYSQMQKSKNDSKAVGLQNKLTGINSDTATDEEMMEVCKEFEAYLVEKVFDRMKDALTDSEEEESDYLSYFGDMMYQEYAKVITENGELGLAQQLYESMKRNTVSPVQEHLQPTDDAISAAAALASEEQDDTE